MIVCEGLTCKQLHCIKTEEMIPNAVYFNAVVFYFPLASPTQATCVHKLLQSTDEYCHDWEGVLWKT